MAHGGGDCVCGGMRSSLTARTRQSEVSATSPAPQTMASTILSPAAPCGRPSSSEKGGNAMPKISKTTTVPSSWQQHSVSRSLQPIPTHRDITGTGCRPISTPAEV